MTGGYYLVGKDDINMKVTYFEDLSGTIIFWTKNPDRAKKFYSEKDCALIRDFIRLIMPEIKTLIHVHKNYGNGVI